MNASDDEVQGQAEPEPVSDVTDWVLHDIVNLAENGIPLPVTLNVGGMLVSGKVVGGREYFEGIAREMGGAVRPYNEKIADAFEKLFRMMGERYPKPLLEGDAAEVDVKDEDFTESNLPPAFIL